VKRRYGEGYDKQPHSEPLNWSDMSRVDDHDPDERPKKAPRGRSPSACGIYASCADSTPSPRLCARGFRTRHGQPRRRRSHRAVVEARWRPFARTALGTLRPRQRLGGQDAHHRAAISKPRATGYGVERLLTRRGRVATGRSSAHVMPSKRAMRAYIGPPFWSEEPTLRLPRCPEERPRGNGSPAAALMPGALVGDPRGAGRRSGDALVVPR
jgi:hypothetical protein